MKIEYININELKEYEKNAKEHPQEQIDQIAASIKEFGNNDPIAIDENNIIIEGHGRLYALRQLEYEEVPVIRLGHLTEDQKRAYIIAHNKLTMNSGFHLETILSELEALDGGLKELTGFTDEEISDMMDSQNKLERETRLIEVDVHNPISTQGDMWILDNRHKVICGDSTDENIYKKLFSDGNTIDLVLTDPPYNVNFGESYRDLSDKYTEGKSFIKHRNIDNDNIENFNEFISSYYKHMKEYIKNGSPLYVFFSGDMSPVYEFDKYFKRSQILSWTKDQALLSRLDYHTMHESIIYGWKEGAKHKWYGDFDIKSTIDPLIPPVRELKNKTKAELLKILTEIQDNDKITTDIFFHQKQRANDKHPTMKPVSLLKRLMRNSSLVDDIIFDGFLGSGSTLIASEELKRITYGVELDEIYTDTIILRYINYKKDNNEEYDIKLIRDGEVIELEDTGLLELLEED